MVVKKTIYGNNGEVPDKLLNMFLSSSPGIRNHMNWRVVAPDPEIPQSYWTILNKQEFIIHNSVTRPDQDSLSKLPTMATIYDKPGAGWDNINPDNYFISYFKTNEMGDVVYNKKKSTTSHQLEEDHITLMTMRHIKAVCSKSNKRQFIIQCMCASRPPVMRGVTVRPAIPIASNPPQWHPLHTLGLVVLLLQTPGGACERSFLLSPCILDVGLRGNSW